MNTSTFIAPTDLRDFLKSHGWTLVEEALKDRLYVFNHAAHARRQLVFPVDLTAPDYAEAVDLVFEKLAGMTGQSIVALRGLAQFAKDDVLRVRVHVPGADDCVLPMSFAASLVENTAKLLKAAACTVLRPRIHHPKLALNDAVELVEKVRFGQTEVGSFVLRVACPLHAIESQGNLVLAGPGTPFVRQVTLVVQRGLGELAAAIEADRVESLIEGVRRSASPVLSSNLCEAVLGMHDEGLGNALDVGIDWSALHPIKDASLRRPVRFQRDYFARIEEVQQELRSAERHEDGALSFIGTVERLDGDLNADGRRSGEVVLSLMLTDEDEKVRAKTMLSVEDYRKASQAHMTNNAYVRVLGRLRPGRQPRQLVDVTSFEVITDG